MPRARFALDRRSGPPDFIGVGSEGPAGDWWHAALVAHPQIRAPRGGELALHFFDRFCARELRDADIEQYHHRFPRRARAINGEWTGSYLADGWVPPLLRRAAPEAKILVMLSDPIDRYRTLFAERKAALEAGKRLIMTDVVDRANHASQLARLGRFYAADRILVLQHERCRADPGVEYRRTLRFLGVRDDVVPADLGHQPPPVRETSPLWPELEAALHATLDPEVETLRTIVPDFDVRLWPHFTHLASGPRARQPSSSLSAS